MLGKDQKGVVAQFATYMAERGVNVSADQVYPDLVIRDESGRIDSVRYDELAPLLLKNMQSERRASAKHDAQLQHQLATQEARISELERQLTSVLATIDPKKNAWFGHAENQLFLAERDGKAVGRISAHCRGQSAR